MHLTLKKIYLSISTCIPGLIGLVPALDQTMLFLRYGGTCSLYCLDQAISHSRSFEAF